LRYRSIGIKHLSTTGLKRLVSILSIILILATLTPAIYSPLKAIASLPSSELPGIFPPSIYRNAEHVHTIDEASVSNHYYSTNVKGYDSLYFAYQSNPTTTSNLASGSPIDDPGFESGIPSADWTQEASGTFASGFPKVERSTAQQSDGTSSLHLSSKSSASSFAWAGVTQTPTHRLPLSSQLTVGYKIFPVSLTSTTSQADSEIQVRFRLLYWDSSTSFPSIVFVYKDNPSDSVGFTNNTDSVYLIRQANFNQWNTVTENLTEIAEAAGWAFGPDFTADQAVNSIQLRAYTKNNAQAEVYFDTITKNTIRTPAEVYGIQANQLSKWSNPSLRLLPGEEPTGASNLFGLNIPPSKFFLSSTASNGPLTDVNTLHNNGLYAGLAHPFQTSSQLSNALSGNFPVDMIDIYGNQGAPYITDTQVWDDYLNKGIIAMATATPNVHAPSGVSRMNTDAHAIYTFADPSASEQDQLENMALGRSFIESVSVGGGSTSTTPMILYFSAANDKIPMGRYPIIVDPNTNTADLHVIITNIPASPAVNLVIKPDGKAIGAITVSLPAGVAKYDNTFSLPLPDSYTYFRYEIQEASTGKALAFSQPLIFAKTASPIHSGFWTAIAPPTKSAALDLPATSVSFDTVNKVLTEQVQVRSAGGVTLPQGDGQQATVRIFIPDGMFTGDQFTSSPSGTFDSTTRILTISPTVRSAAPTTITVSGTGSPPPPPPPPQLPYHYEPFIALSGTNFTDRASTPQLQLAKFSVGSWFLTSKDHTTVGHIVNKGGSGSETAGRNMNYGIWMSASEQIQGGFETSTGVDNYVTSPLKYNDGKWHYAVVTYDASAAASPAVRLYIDGALVGTKATTDVPDTGSTQPVRIGANSRTPDGFFTGNADEIRVWDRQLTAQEVQNAYANGQFADPQAVLYVPS
jgi:hypothetical protein